MKLDGPHLIRASGSLRPISARAKTLGQPGLPGARRPLQDQVLLGEQQVVQARKRRHGQERPALSDDIVDPVGGDRLGLRDLFRDPPPLPPRPRFR